MSAHIPSDISVYINKRVRSSIGRMAFVTHFHQRKVNASYQSTCRSMVKWSNNECCTNFKNDARNGFTIVYNPDKWDGLECEVIDPLGFIFHIPTRNMLEIIQHSDVYHGVIDREFVLSWDDEVLMLLPTDTDEYTKGMEDVTGMEYATELDD